MHIVVVCGTNRDGAISRKLTASVADCYRPLVSSVDVLDMAELPTETLLGSAYEEKPESTSKMVDRFLLADGVVFIVPEYNGSYPGVLKLFVDMLPFPRGFDARPCAFIGLAAGHFRSLRAVEHFQQVAAYRNAHLFPRRVFIGDSYKQFDEGDQLVDAELKTRIEDQATGFCKFIASIKGSGH